MDSTVVLRIFRVLPFSLGRPHSSCLGTPDVPRFYLLTFRAHIYDQLEVMAISSVSRQCWILIRCRHPFMWASPGASRMFGSAEGFGSWSGAGVSAMAGHRVTYNGLCLSRLRYSNLSQRESQATFCGAVRFKPETVRGPGEGRERAKSSSCVSCWVCGDDVRR